MPALNSRDGDLTLRLICDDDLLSDKFFSCPGFNFESLFDFDLFDPLRDFLPTNQLVRRAWGAEALAERLCILTDSSMVILGCKRAASTCNKLERKIAYVISYIRYKVYFTLIVIFPPYNKWINKTIDTSNC